jgi:hypothetical protein
VGDIADIAELGNAAATGRDRHGRPVSRLELAIMGVAAILPLVGSSALRMLGKGARGPVALAARFGRTVDEMDALLARARMLTPQDRAVIGRVERALRTGAKLDPNDLRHVRESLDRLGFVIDLAPSNGDVFLFPDLGRNPLEPWGASGETAETAAIRAVGKRGAGLSRPPRHHVLPREHRKWFEERGFVGERDIDNYTVELEEAAHQAVHGGGNWRLGRTWPGEWNRRVMEELRKREKKAGRRLRIDEVLSQVKDLMSEYEIDQSFVRYTAP